MATVVPATPALLPHATTMANEIAGKVVGMSAAFSPPNHFLTRLGYPKRGAA